MINEIVAINRSLQDKLYKIKKYWLKIVDKVDEEDGVYSIVTDKDDILVLNRLILNGD